MSTETTWAGMEAYYEDYWRRGDLSHIRDPFFETRLRLLERHMAGVKRATVLDVGSGAGELVSRLHAEGHRAMGIEISATAIEIARRAHPECEFVQHAVEERPWPLEQGSYDVVASFEVIEHLVRPRELLMGAHDALRKGGHLALTTPYHGILKNLALSLRGFDTHFSVEGDHIRFFSDRALRALLEQTGFEHVKFSHFGRAPGLWAGVMAWATRA